MATRRGHNTLYAVTRLPIPWFSLMLVCKNIANEMQHYVLGRSTYTFSTISSSFDNTLAHCVFWQGIPCPPSSVRILEATLMLSCWTRCWWAGDDEPTPLISDLCRLVNSFTHKGPLVTRERPLGERIHLNTLICAFFCSFLGEEMVEFFDTPSAHQFGWVRSQHGWGGSIEEEALARDAAVHFVGYRPGHVVRRCGQDRVRVGGRRD
ncbi:hypothetical protein C8R45DRAFT_995124 [Mycena sanguinolenta]|nr:hypothetical protein C8R45DRAFT_995124 [Mycena sanguinolenta]